MQKLSAVRDRTAERLDALRTYAQSRRRCGSGEPSPGADVAAVSPVSVQMWQRCGEPSPGADVAGVSPVPAQMWQA